MHTRVSQKNEPYTAEPWLCADWTANDHAYSELSGKNELVYRPIRLGAPFCFVTMLMSIYT